MSFHPHFHPIVGALVMPRPQPTPLRWGVCGCDTSEETINFYRRGAQKAHRAVPNEALYGVLRISRLITWTYLQFPILFSHGKGLSQEPQLRSCGFSSTWQRATPRTLYALHGFMDFFICIVAAIWYFFLFYVFTVFDVMDDSGI